MRISDIRFSEHTWRVAAVTVGFGLAIRAWQVLHRPRLGRILPQASSTAVQASMDTDEMNLATAQVPKHRISPSEVVAAPQVAGVKAPPWRQFYSFMKESIQAWIDDYAPSMGAALSYYTVFSIAPLLLIVISVAGLVFGEEAARGHISATLSSFLGPEGAIAPSRESCVT